MELMYQMEGVTIVENPQEPESPGSDNTRNDLPSPK